MNNIDVSIMNVLTKLYPDIFSQYFNDVGVIPNPTVETRKKAEDIFKLYSTQTFESFMQKYRNLIVEQNDEFCIETNANNSTQTTFDENLQVENNVCEEETSSPTNTVQEPTTSQEPASSQESWTSEQAYSNLISDSISKISSFKKKKHTEEFDVLNFLKEKQLNKNYIFLDFQIQEIEDELFIINGCPGDKETNKLAKKALEKMSEYLEILNRLYSYRILNVYLEKSQ